MARQAWLIVIILTAVSFVGCTSPFAKDGPLEFVELTLSRNSIGTPEIGVTVTNVSAKPVKAFTIKAQAWNAYGSLLKEFGFGDSVFSGISQKTIEPGQTRTVWWTLYGYDTAYEIEVSLDSAMHTDGKKWTAGGIWVEDLRYIKKASY